VAPKPLLTAAQIESQTALELPARDMLALITLILLNGVVVFIPIRNNDVAVQVCAQLLANQNTLDCRVTQ
jgi:hypothetical protein